MPDDKVRVLFLQTNNPGVVWYRMFQFAQKMSDLGLAHSRMFPTWNPVDLTLTMKDWETEYEKVMPTLTDMVEWADFVVFQYIHSEKGLSIAQAIRDLKPTFVEVDDSFSHVPFESIAYDSNRPGYALDVWATRQIMECHGVITTTDNLKNHYLQYNNNVNVIPNCIDFDLWDSYETHKNERIRIGWVGGDTHAGDLKLVKDVLYQILDEYPNVEAYIVCGNPPKWEKHQRLHMVATWAYITDYAKMVKDFSFDIGLVPLKDNYFNRGKSNLKYLEYSACRTPTVASAVEPFRSDFKGLLVEKDEDWYIYLRELIEDEDFRLKIGQNAYFHVKEEFNLNKIAVEYSDLIKKQLGWHGNKFHDQQRRYEWQL